MKVKVRTWCKREFEIEGQKFEIVFINCKDEEACINVISQVFRLYKRIFICEFGKILKVQVIFYRNSRHKFFGYFVEGHGKILINLSLIKKCERDFRATLAHEVVHFLDSQNLLLKDWSKDLFRRDISYFDQKHERRAYTLQNFLYPVHREAWLSWLRVIDAYLKGKKVKVILENGITLRITKTSMETLFNYKIKDVIIEEPSKRKERKDASKESKSKRS